MLVEIILSAVSPKIAANWVKNHGHKYDYEIVDKKMTEQMRGMLRRQLGEKTMRKLEREDKVCGGEGGNADPELLHDLEKWLGKVPAREANEKQKKLAAELSEKVKKRLVELEVEKGGNKTGEEPSDLKKVIDAIKRGLGKVKKSMVEVDGEGEWTYIDEKGGGSGVSSSWWVAGKGMNTFVFVCMCACMCVMEA